MIIVRGETVIYTRDEKISIPNFENCEVAIEVMDDGKMRVVKNRYGARVDDLMSSFNKLGA